MVRYCVVPNCPSNDTVILSHRFPRNAKIAKEWQTALELDKIPLSDLIKRYVVCTNHFDKSSYRNEASNFLNFTAVPKLYFAEPNDDNNTTQNDQTESVDTNPENNVQDSRIESTENPDEQLKLIEIEIDNKNVSQRDTIQGDDSSMTSDELEDFLTIANDNSTSYSNIKSYSFQANKQRRTVFTQRKRGCNELSDDSERLKIIRAEETKMHPPIDNKQFLRKVEAVTCNDVQTSTSADRSCDTIREKNREGDAEMKEEREQLNMLTKDQLIDELIKARKFICEMKGKLCEYLNE